MGSDKGMHNSMPRQVIIGRLGLIYYIGPLLTQKDMVQQIADHIQDTSLGIMEAKRAQV